MKSILLTQNKVALVDDEEFEKLNQHKWYALKTTYGGFVAVRHCRCLFGKKRYTILMHRQIMSCPQGKDVDHKNHKTLDNQRYNLRICTRSQNMMNNKRQGVCWDRTHEKWVARICLNYQRIFIGHFDSKIEAITAYNQKAKELFGEFAYRRNSYVKIA